MVLFLSPQHGDGHVCLCVSPFVSTSFSLSLSLFLDTLFLCCDATVGTGTCLIGFISHFLSRLESLSPSLHNSLSASLNLCLCLAMEKEQLFYRLFKSSELFSPPSLSHHLSMCIYGTLSFKHLVAHTPPPMEINHFSLPAVPLMSLSRHVSLRGHQCCQVGRDVSQNAPPLLRRLRLKVSVSVSQLCVCVSIISL